MLLAHFSPCSWANHPLIEYQEASFRHADSMRKFDEDLKKTAPGLYKHLGYRMWSA